MPQSLTNLQIHLIFSVAERKRCFRTAEMRTGTEQYMAGILVGMDCFPLEIGLAVDHAHLLFGLGRRQAVADVVRDVKAGSSRWIKEQIWARGNVDFHRFHWQKGYSAFSVSASKVGAVQAYIAGQIEHHRRVTFQDEYREFLVRHGVGFDEKYVWE